MLYNDEKINADCIIPAAGLSSRMGQWKPMLPLHRSTLIRESISNALAVCERVILVTGYRAEELTEHVSIFPNLNIIFNPHYEKGLVSSIQAGVEQVTRSHFFIAHADMPFISPGIYRSLWKHRTEGTVFPGNQDFSGHPALLSACLKQAILSQLPSQSIKGLLMRFPVHYLNLGDEAISLDMDTPEDYQRLKTYQQ